MTLYSHHSKKGKKQQIEWPTRNDRNSKNIEEKYELAILWGCGGKALNVGMLAFSAFLHHP